MAEAAAINTHNMDGIGAGANGGAGGADASGAERPKARKGRGGAAARGAAAVGRVAGQVLHGRVVSLEFFRRHWLAVLCVVGMLIVYITGRYYCQTMMEEIKKLENDLEVVRTERVREKSTYMSRIRESSMQQRVDSLRLGLTVSEQPPYVLEIED